MARFTDGKRAEFVGLVRSGRTIEESCATVGVTRVTVNRWIAEGREQESGDAADFAEAVEKARGIAAKAMMDRDEFDRCLAKSVRAGNVNAMKLWWDINRPQDEEQRAAMDPFEQLDREDELAQRRSARG